MFIINSPEGQKSFSATDLKLDLMKVSKSKPDLPIGESDEGKDIFNLAYKSTTRNDSAIKSYTDNNKPEHGHILVTVEEIMTRNVVTIQKKDSLEKAWLLMVNNRINHLPVYDESILVGLVSSHDVLKKVIVDNLDKFVESAVETVAEIMELNVISTLIKTDIRKVALVMSEYRVGCILVVNDSSDLLGIVSGHDLIRRLSEEPPVTLYV